MIAALVLTAAMVVPLNEEFFIVSSIDVAQSRLLLKRPTEVTVPATITSSTRIHGERGESLRLSDLRSGDTVYAVTSKLPNGQLMITSLRRGPMTVEELHRRYLR